jgi:hypothetical protein
MSAQVKLICEAKHASVRQSATGSRGEHAMAIRLLRVDNSERLVNRNNGFSTSNERKRHPFARHFSATRSNENTARSRSELGICLSSSKSTEHHTHFFGAACFSRGPTCLLDSSLFRCRDIARPEDLITCKRQTMTFKFKLIFIYLVKIETLRTAASII